MISKKNVSRISLILVAVLMTTITYPYYAAAQTLNQNSGFLYGVVDEDGNVDTSNIDGSLQIFDYPTQNPTNIYDDQVKVLNGGTTDVRLCLTSIVQDSLINTVTGSLGGALGDLGIGQLFGDAMGGLSGTLSGVVSNTLGSVGNSIGGQLGGALGDLGGSLGGKISDSLGGIAGGLLGGGDAQVPTTDRAVIERTSRIQQLEEGRSAVELGDGATSLNSIAYCLANQAIEGILQGTIDWVNRGFDGNPAFVDNPEKFFGDIADYELGGLLDELSGGLLCSNIDASIRVDLISDYNSQRYRGYDNRRRCTLSEISDNVEAFTNGDFSQGGWDAWLEYTTNPYNNYYGASIAVRQDLNDRISRSQSLAAIELDWNNGYQSIRDRETGDITTPGSMVRSQVEKRMNAPIDRLTFADEFDELMNSMLDQFVKISIGEIFD